MKQICWFLFLLLIVTQVRAQSGKDSSSGEVVLRDTVTAKDTVVRVKKPVVRTIKVVDTTRKMVDTVSPKSDTSLPSGVPVNDSATVAKDSLAAARPEVPVRKGEPYNKLILKNPWYNFAGKPMAQLASRREEGGKDGQFYLLCGVVLFFALIKLIFGKYLQNLFAVFFRISMKQKQLREQLLQTPFPSLMLNLLFIIAGGIYTAYLARYYEVFNDVNEWLLIFYASLGLAIIYISKLLVLKLTGWIFNMRDATDTYIFVVFLVNKLLGIFLLPIILLMAFADSGLASVVVTLSYIMIFLFFGYRYLISYSAVRKEIKLSPFHFFLYLCAFEIIPLVLIYKVLLEFVYRSP